MKTIVVRESSDHISEAAIRQSAAKIAPTNSVLIVIRGMILAHTIPIAILDLPVAFNQDIKALIFREIIAPRFGLWNLVAQASTILGSVSTAAHGTKRLDMETITALPILVPPIALQEKFITRCALIEATLQQAYNGASESDAVFDSLQRNLFSAEVSLG